ncbi:uncharacterized protein LOC144438624 [Glandiceps talaboti]
MWRFALLCVIYLSLAAASGGMNDGSRDTEDTDKILKALVKELDLLELIHHRQKTVGNSKIESKNELAGESAFLPRNTNKDASTHGSKAMVLSTLIKKYAHDKETTHPDRKITQWMPKKAESACYDNEFTCVDNGHCINGNWECDDIPDCDDGSDEDHCQDCKEDEFSCYNGDCIPSFWECDTESDCSDNSDEEGCGCADKEFTCENGKCIGNVKVCNGVDNCGDKSDEEYCDCKYDSEFTCDNGKCILNTQECDGKDHCGDNSDEENCVSSSANSCAEGYFTCNDGECTYDYWECDGFTDCFDGSDEDNCNNGEGWSEWTDWGECNVECGTGEHFRSRHCLNDEGTGCDGNNVEYSLCHLTPCYQEAATGCGTRKMPAAPRIVGGEDASPQEWPWPAQLHYKPYDDVVCGGTLIGPKHVVSAAHCFYPDGPWTNEDNWIVRLGKFQRDSATGYGDEPRELKIRRIYRHRLYNEDTFDNDIALLELDEPVDPTDYINYACLDTAENIDFDEHSYCFVTGWGSLRGDIHKVPEVLQEAMVPLLSLHKCNAASAYNGSLTSNMICAGYFSGGIDSCQGDSGGPLVCMHRNADSGLGHWYLVGVVSFGEGCAEANTPGIYADVKKYIDWIRNKGGI